MSIKSEFQSALADQAATALKQIVADKPSLTTGDLRTLVSEHPSLGELTVSELLGDAPARRGRSKARASAKGKTKRKAKAKAPARRTRARGKSGWNVRTAEGREAFDKAVLDALEAAGGQDVSAEQLRDLGATPHQLRSSLNRHIEAGRVSFTGKARGTRYSLAQ